MELLKSFKVPEFQLPFERSKHTHAERANAEATAWALRHGLVNEAAADSFAGIGFGHLAARVSHAAPYEHVVTFAQWMAWSFVLDDQHDHLIRVEGLEEWRPITQAMTAHLAGRRPGRSRGNPLVRGFVELSDRILAGMPAGIQARYRAHIPQMLDSLDREAANRRTAGPPTITDYVLMRRHSSQLPPMMDMSEAALGIEVAPEIYASPMFQELLWSAVDVISWGNDLFSLPKESSCGDNNNIALVLVQRHGLSLPEVVRAVQARIAARVGDFLAAEHMLPRALDALGVTEAGPRAAALECVANYRDWMIGADLWQRRECTRYVDERWAVGPAAAYTVQDLVRAA